MSDHHLILGSLKDYLTGKKILDTHDERYRQKIARYLVENKDFNRKSIISGMSFQVIVGKKSGTIHVDFLIKSEETIGMMIKYGPGSLVTRYNPAIAISRIIAPCQVPLIVVTNGVKAHLIDGVKGEVIAKGFESLPDRNDLKVLLANIRMPVISESKKELARRIAFAYEIHGACNCGDCVLDC